MLSVDLMPNASLIFIEVFVSAQGDTKETHLCHVQKLVAEVTMIVGILKHATLLTYQKQKKNAHLFAQPALVHLVQLVQQ